jgi:hypothetical protein
LKALLPHPRPRNDGWLINRGQTSRVHDAIATDPYVGHPMTSGDMDEMRNGIVHRQFVDI